LHANVQYTKNESKHSILSILSGRTLRTKFLCIFKQETVTVIEHRVKENFFTFITCDTYMSPVGRLFPFITQEFTTQREISLRSFQGTYFLSMKIFLLAVV
jgi:hypothetical protein